MTFSQVINAYSGYFERERERAKVVQVMGWETIRWQTWILFNLQVSKKGRINNPQKLIQFEWDKKPEAPKKEEWDKINSLFPDVLKHANE